MMAVDLDNSKIYLGKNGTWQNSGDPSSGFDNTGSAFTITFRIEWYYAFVQEIKNGSK